MADEVEKVVPPGLPASAPGGGAVKQGNSVVITVKIHRDTYNQLMEMYGGSPGKSDLIAWMIKQTLKPAPGKSEEKKDLPPLPKEKISIPPAPEQTQQVKTVTQERSTFSMSDIFLR